MRYFTSSLVFLTLFFQALSHSAPKSMPPSFEPSSLTFKAYSKVEGYSVKRKPIVSYRFGSGKETVLFFGVFHGDEGQGADLLDRLMDEISRKPDLIEGKRVVVVPVVNPDGMAKIRRTNARGVDLNRNFQTRDWTRRHHLRKCNPGTRNPEPETKAVMKIIREYNPSIVVTLHAYLNCNNFDGPGENLAFRMAKRNHFKVSPYIGYDTPGSFGTYYGKERGIPVITLELSKATTEQSWNGHREAFLSVLGYADGQKDGENIIAAAAAGKTENVLDFIRNGVSTEERDDDGWTPLLMASYYGHVETVRALLNHGADPNGTDWNGGTPLQFAAQNDHDVIVKILLDKGAYVNARDRFGSTALMEAGRNANLDPLKILLAHGADIHMRDGEGKTVLIDTARRGFLQTMQVLVDNGANVNDRDQYGRTALMVAAERDYPAMARRLVELGADVKAADTEGHTAMYEARLNNNRKIVHILKNADNLRASVENIRNRPGK